MEQKKDLQKKLKENKLEVKQLRKRKADFQEEQHQERMRMLGVEGNNPTKLRRKVVGRGGCGRM